MPRWLLVRGPPFPTTSLFGAGDVGRPRLRKMGEGPAEGGRLSIRAPQPPQKAPGRVRRFADFAANAKRADTGPKGLRRRPVPR